jgi:hypothetical protein
VELDDAGDAGSAETDVDGCSEVGAAGTDAPAELEHATITGRRTARSMRVGMFMSQRR